MLPLLLGLALADPGPANVILADLGLHVIGLGYQRTLTPHVALQGDLDLWVPWTQNIDPFHLLGVEGDAAGFVLRARPVFFPFGAAPLGMWISPFVQGGPARGTRDGEVRFGSGWAGGLSVGYAGVVAKHLHLSVGAGGQYHAAIIPGGSSSPSFHNVFPTVDLTVGYAF
ncbi:MAG TPA: hypothetical protein PKA64_19495 [Myxococcota bacterium]|nr:hypothetical protein [Myxococcota bacterium]